MTQINVNFQNQSPVIIDLQKGDTEDIYIQLLKDNLEKQPPMWRDPLQYDLDYFKQLCQQIKKQLGWAWDLDKWDLESTVQYHKDIEHYLEKDESFKNIPGEQQQLLHEAHFCIHQIQYSDDRLPRGAFLQLEWFNDSYKELPDSKEFKVDLDYGDVILQNPYVGHPPIQCWQNRDNSNIDRTCAFHDRILPGLKIVLTQKPSALDYERYKKWWSEECTDFVNKVGMDKIIKYTGFPVIGEIRDKQHLGDIIKIKGLKFEGITIL